MSAPSHEVILSSRALRCVRDGVMSWPDVETGGLLLGYRGDGVLHVLAATEAGGAERGSARCTLEPAAALAEAEIVAERFEPTLQLLGVWHSHPGAGPVASRVDAETLRSVALLNGCPMLSLIVSRDDPAVMGLWCLLDSGDEPVKAMGTCDSTQWTVAGDRLDDCSRRIGSRQTTWMGENR